MFAKLNRYSLIAALTIATGALSAAHASPTEDDEIYALESGNPHSVDFSARHVGTRPVTQEDLDDLESGNPESVNYKDRNISSRTVTNEELLALETGNPDAIQ